jgi:hypothetical protein
MHVQGGGKVIAVVAVHRPDKAHVIDMRIEMSEQFRRHNAGLSAWGVIPKRADDFFLPILGRFTGATIHLGLRIKRVNVANSPR